MRVDVAAEGATAALGRRRHGAMVHRRPAGIAAGTNRRARGKRVACMGFLAEGKHGTVFGRSLRCSAECTAALITRYMARPQSDAMAAAVMRVCCAHESRPTLTRRRPTDVLLHCLHWVCSIGGVVLDQNCPHARALFSHFFHI